MKEKGVIIVSHHHLIDLRVRQLNAYSETTGVGSIYRALAAIPFKVEARSSRENLCNFKQMEKKAVKFLFLYSL